MNSDLPFVVGITGASGVPYAQRLLRFFLSEKISTHLVLTKSAYQVIEEEVGVQLGSESDLNKGLEKFIGKGYERFVTFHPLHDWSSPLASGSYKSGPMIVIPCSVHSLAAIANGHASNLLERRADIMLKERRKLILVFRETPLNAIHLENLLKLSQMGAYILPAMPGFYHQPKTIQDMIDFVVGKTLDLLDVPNELFKRWGNRGESLFLEK